MKRLSSVDPDIAKLVKQEEKRQQDTLMMIPSENTTSKAVEEAIGTSLGNKYAEGYPTKRYYQGQRIVDKIEQLAIDRAKRLFSVPYANVQPYSGSPANLAVLSAIVPPGGTIMGLALSSGGHLTHGASASFTSKFFHSVPYDTDKKGYIDYEALAKQVKKERPIVLIAGTTAYARILDWEKFRSIADSVGAYLFADISHIAGLVAGKVYPSPVPYAHIISTTTHKTLRGPRGAIIMVTEEGIKKNAELPTLIAKAVFPGLQGGPHMNTIAGIAVALKEVTTTRFARYAKQIVVNAKMLADSLKKLGFTLITDGTDSHLILIDLRPFSILGNTMAEAAEAANIVFNRNSIPFDTNSPFYPSGIRLGTPGITSRGMKQKEMKMIAKWLSEIIHDIQAIKKKKYITSEEEKKKDIRQSIILASQKIPTIRKAVIALTKRFPNLKEY